MSVTWYDGSTAEGAERLKAAWVDAPTENLELLGMLASVARGQVMRYALDSEVPAEHLTVYLAGQGYSAGTVTAVLALLELEPPETPVNWVYAQLAQVRNLWNAGRTGGEGGIGPEGFVFQPRPLDRTIRNIINPPSGDVDVY